MTTSNLTNTEMNNLLNAILGTSSLTAFSGSANLRLTTSAPTASTPGTELSGTGYTAGGSVIAFSSASSQASAGPTGSALQWTNGSGSSWSIVGYEVYDSAGTPVQWLWGTFTGQPITVANGNIFQIAVSGISVAWQ
jgi:hypothetical protein